MLTPSPLAKLKTEDAPPTRMTMARFGRALGPGLILLGAIALAAAALRLLPVLSALSPMIIAVTLGIALRSAVALPSSIEPGVAFGQRRLLRLAVILLGLQLTPQQIVTVGFAGFCLIAATLVATFLVTRVVGRLIGVPPPLSELIAAGTAICGASAVLCTNGVSRGSEEDVAYAVGCVTIFGTLAMLIDPLIGTALALDPRQYGLWAGASIHEVAQVVAAAFQHGQEAGEFGTIAKLSRVILLAPLVLSIGFVRARQEAARADGAAASPQIPWFVFGFIALILVNGTGLVPQQAKAVLVPATTILLTLALAAMGLSTNLGRLRAKGLRPLALGAFATMFIAGASLAPILAMRY